MTSKSRLSTIKLKNCEIYDILAFDFLIVESLVIRPMFLIQFMIEKRRPNVQFTTFYEPSVSHNLFSKAEILKREPMFMRLSGTDVLKQFLE